MAMVRRVAVVVAIALLCSCGRVAPLRPAQGEPLPVKPLMAQTTPSAEQLLNPPTNADPERVDELVRVVMAEIDTVRAAGVPQDVVDKVRESFRRSRETEMRENSTWLVRLMSYDRHGWDARGINENLAASRISVDRVRDAARLYLDPARRVQVSLVPEGAAP